MDSPVVIAGLDPAIPIIWHGPAIVSGMAGSSPAMTIQGRPNMRQANKKGPVARAFEFVASFLLFW